MLLREKHDDGTLSRLNIHDTHLVLASGMVLFVGSLVSPCKERLADLNQLTQLL